jgi:hypothetical protein
MLNNEQFKEHLIGYHHTHDLETANKIMSEGFHSPDNWSYFMNSPDPTNRYGKHVIEVAVNPKNVEIDENSRVGQKWQMESEPENHTGDWSKDVWMTAPNEDITPLRVIPPSQST